MLRSECFSSASFSKESSVENELTHKTTNRYHVIVFCERKPDSVQSCSSIRFLRPSDLSMLQTIRFSNEGLKPNQDLKTDSRSKDLMVALSRTVVLPVRGSSAAPAAPASSIPNIRNASRQRASGTTMARRPWEDQ